MSSRSRLLGPKTCSPACRILMTGRAPSTASKATGKSAPCRIFSFQAMPRSCCEKRPARRERGNRRKSMRVKKLLHTRMRVSDMDQTIRFYQEVLGLEVMERKVSPRGSHLAFLKVPNSEELIELCSFPPSGAVRVQEDLVHLAFEVETLDV